MKKLIKNILLGLIFTVIPIITFSQEHVVPNYPSEYNPHIKIENYIYKRNNVWASADSIHISSSQILSGDSILMLTGDKTVVITSASIKYQGTVPYTTSGSTDTTTIYSRYNNISYPVLYILDELYEEESVVSSEQGGTHRTDIDSCFYYLKIPTGKYTLGNGSYTLFYEYKILD